MDIGLRNCRLNFRQMGLGHIMEKIIFNELVSQEYKKMIISIVTLTNDNYANDKIND